MKLLSYPTTAKLTIAAGITAAMTSLVVLTGFGSGSWLLGGLGDLLDVLNSLLVIPLFLALGALTGALNEPAGRFVQIMGVAGALVRMAGAFLIVSGIMAYEQAVLLVNGGAGLMGIAILLFAAVNRTRPALRSSYLIFSAMVGGVMALSLLGLLLNDQFTPLLRGEVSFAEANPLVVALLLLSPLFILGYPIWLLWTGRLLLKSTLGYPDVSAAAA
ncbi:MAG: hypothetical protein ACK2UK_11250 [Candidatus Promineifilaceae bacterium]